eukprot:CAMPEP_0202370036 /NCGR_PEP_ID=MMETSP1127-20130417/1744_1 /ASSEMBLY_ACC=CAM_ASM_000462 /TAXON_ID=3047 /ORGANISM="Dunaliella tertiolecta, Strain CCMP1320" /LENGTH=1145 /DNA_ID=CAMNT_0048965873 /DNA_START=13 /DNA_END=3450 /DNA_ORIENTATION=-
MSSFSICNRPHIGYARAPFPHHANRVIPKPCSVHSTAASHGIHAANLRPTQLKLSNLVGLRHQQQVCLGSRISSSRFIVGAATLEGAEQVEREVLRSTSHDAGLHVEVAKAGDKYEVVLTPQPSRPMLLHWGVDNWNVPPQSLWPQGTQQAGDKACQTPFPPSGSIYFSLDEESCPSSLSFVLKETEPENWLNDGGVDFTVTLKPPSIDTLVNQIMDAEGTYTHWSLFQRFCMAMETMDALDAAGPKGMALIFTWLRLSSMRQLDWYRNSNYQSKDIAHVQKSIAQKMADKARSAKDPRCRVYARMALEGLPRGGGNGDDIRMGILNIMRGNGIKEGHRPGIEEHFLEQWHQKLHTNTTPDDIAICSAYLAFLHSNDGGEFWRVLWDMAKLTPEDLANFDKPITAFPMHLPHLIDPFKHYLWLLKVTHSGADLDTAAVMAQGHMDDDLSWNVFDILANRNEWWVPGKIVEVRSRLAHYWQAPGASRDLLMLDLALESWFRLLVERTDLAALQGDDLMAMISLVLRNTIVGVHDEELSSVVDQWEWLQQGASCESGRWSKDWAMAGLASLQRAELALAQYMDTMYAEVQPHAERFAEACKLDRAYIDNFGEEVVRGRPLFVLAPLIQALQPMMREAAGVSSWQVVSQGQGLLSGVLTPTASLADVQGKSYAEGPPTLLLAEHVGGNEDIPEGIQAVITRSATDVLSHAAIRARAQQVLLASCNDTTQWEGLQTLAAEAKAASKAVTLTVTPEGDVRGLLGGDIALEAAKSGASGAGAAAGAPKRLQQPMPSAKWALQESEFGTAGQVGGKASNCSSLAAMARSGALPEWLQVPASMALPWGTFERVLQDPSNAQVAKAVASGLQEVEAAAAAASGDLTKALQGLASLRQLVSTQLKAPEALVQECASTAAAQGLIPSAGMWAAGSPGWKHAWSAICKVWASKWNDRAWLSRRALKLPDDDLVMGVLLQQVVPADYAYVLHTANPVTGTPGQAFGEAVVGMGEALVGNYPGRALSFTAPLDGASPPAILSLPAKRVALRAPTTWAGSNGTGAPLLIARSDANGEDLEDLAGAGLYDSIPFAPLEETVVGYADEPLMTDPAFRAQIISQLTDVAKVVKGAYKGQEQDIEGVISHGKVWVVQSRPQVIS